MLDWTRREFVRGLGLGTLGLGLPEVLARQARAEALGGPLGRPRRAKRAIMIFLFGGPSQIDTWDMKPAAPLEFRGEFQPIDTAVHGIQCCEHLPRVARWTQRLAILRSLTMTGRGIGDHHADTYYILTGRHPDRSFFTEGIDRKVHDDDWPCLGATVALRLPHERDLPGNVQLPALSGEVTGYINPGQFSGKLGPAYEPFLIRGALEKPRDLVVPALALPGEINADRLGQRRDLLGQLDAWQRRSERTGVIDTYQTHEQQAFSLLTSEKSKQAFDVAREPEADRARYGEDINGQSFLLARRLVESGVPFVCVHWIGRRVGAGLSWDTHSDNFGQLKNVLLPAFDAAFSALLEDLEVRGLLDETLILVTAEMGRTPKVGDPRTGGQGPPGRDHWIHCQTALMAGGGIQGGQHYGVSDKQAGYPADHPVSPEDLAATLYRALGIDDDLLFTDREGRVQSLLQDGARVLPLFA